MDVSDYTAAELRELRGERAAIYEYDGELTREESERRAISDVAAMVSNKRVKR